MFIDFTAPGYRPGDIIKIKGKSTPHKIIEIVEENDEQLYLTRPLYDLLIHETQIQHIIKRK